MRIAAQYRAFFVKIKFGLFYDSPSYASRTQIRTPRPSETLPAVRLVFTPLLRKIFMPIVLICLMLVYAGLGAIFLVAT